MSDTALVGIVGIFASAVLGPLVAYLIRRAEDGRRDVVDTLDGAVGSLTQARGTVNWMRAADPEGDDSQLDVELRRSLEEMHLAESYQSRLQIRLGADHPIVKSYTDAIVALAVLGSEVYADRNAIPQSFSPEEIDKASNEIDALCETFLGHARAWHAT